MGDRDAPPISERLDDEHWVWFGRATHESLRIVQSLFSDEGENRDYELLEWQYLGRRHGSYVAIAHGDAGLESSASALYAALPSTVFRGGRTVSAVQSYDSITAKQARGKGLFSRLGKYTYEKLKSEDISLVYGIPNDNINSARQKQLGWRSLDPLPMFIRPIGLRYPRVKIGIRRPRKLSLPVTRDKLVSRIESCPPDLRDLFFRSDLRDRVGVMRDSEFMSWRMRRPGADYVWFESRDASGLLTGFSGCELQIKHGCATGYVMDVIFDRGLPHIADSHIDAMVDHLRKCGADVVLAWSIESSQAAEALKRHGFFYFWERARPTHLHLGYRFLDSEASLRRSDLSFSYLDSDTV